MTRAHVYRCLPGVFRAWYALILGPALQLRPGQHQRNAIEARTLVEALDELVNGGQLSVIMMLLGRLKAIAFVVLQDGTWATAHHHEVVRPSSTGLLTERDIRHAQRDQRDAQRLANGGRAAPAERRREPS